MPPPAKLAIGTLPALRAARATPWITAQTIQRCCFWTFTAAMLSLCAVVDGWQQTAQWLAIPEEWSRAARGTAGCGALALAIGACVVFFRTPLE